MQGETLMYWMTSSRLARSLSVFAAVLVAVLITVLADDTAAQTLTPFQQGWRSGTPVTVTGVVTAIYDDDFANHRADLIHVVTDERTGQSFQLRYEKMPPHLQSGTRIRIDGRSITRRDTAVAELYVAGCCDSTAATPSMTFLSLPPAPSGDQPTLVMLGNFSDAAVSCSASNVNDVVFAGAQSVASVYRDNSLGRISVSGNVVGPYTIAASSNGPCDLGAWATAVETAATAAGANLSAYAHHVVVLPQNACFGTGKGTMGGSPSTAWVFKCDDASMYQHELGHNFGMDHASVDDGTTIYEYDDTTDPMGFSTGPEVKGFNAPHRYQMGWIGRTAAQLITQGGGYNIAPLALDPSTTAAPQDLLIAKPDTKEYYHLSYRTLMGFDNHLGANTYGALSVHRFMGDGTVDLHTYRVGLLQDGQQFVDSINGIAITMASHNSSYATIQVQLTCIPSIADLSIAPQAQSGTSGATLNYAISVTNKDPGICAPRTFTLNGAVPAGWAKSFSPGFVSLGPGQAAPVTFSVTSSSTAAAGTYTATVTAADSSPNTSIAASGTTPASSMAVYTVLAPLDTVPPSAPSGLSATVNRKLKQVELSWNAATDNVGVSGYSIFRNGGTVAISNLTTWTDQAVESGVTYTYFVVAYDAAGNMSARSNSVPVTVNANNGKK
jgi:alpha-galactosidase-like protein/peptidase M66-like protein